MADPVLLRRMSSALELDLSIENTTSIENFLTGKASSGVNKREPLCHDRVRKDGLTSGRDGGVVVAQRRMIIRMTT